MSERWREAWRTGLAPLLSDRGLRALAAGLEADDPKLVQGATVLPQLTEVEDWPVEGCCPVAYCAWQGDGVLRPAMLDDHLARVCEEADRRLRDAGAKVTVFSFLFWWDHGERAKVRRELLYEAKYELVLREGARVRP